MGNKQGQPIPGAEIPNDPELKQAVEFYKVYKQQPLSVVYNSETNTCNAVCGPDTSFVNVKPPLNILLVIIVFVVGLALGYVVCSYMIGGANSNVNSGMRMMQPMPVYQQS